jgi:hypothetical protein
MPALSESRLTPKTSPLFTAAAAIAGPTGSNKTWLVSFNWTLHEHCILSPMLGNIWVALWLGGAVSLASIIHQATDLSALNLTFDFVVVGGEAQLIQLDRLGTWLIPLEKVVPLAMSSRTD